MCDFSDFERGQIVGARSEGASVKKRAELLNVSQTTVPTVMTACTKHGASSSAKRNSDRNPKLPDRDRRTLQRIVARQHKTTAAKVTAELNTHLRNPVSTKTVRRELHKANIHGRAAIAKPLITDANAKLRKKWCHEHKTWTLDDWKNVVISGYSAGPLIHITGRMPANEYLDILNDEVLTMMSVLLQNTAIFQDDNAPIYLVLVRRELEYHQIFSLACIIARPQHN
ncbi:uncharacterized protein LOC143039321 [Oratosquilla oratoria]|uniref:uncharacterized protein LOC143039321 n=1 Tax=Oratosquilla oratoria TaxID=337810 RepID=UPI003F75B567